MLPCNVSYQKVGISLYLQGTRIQQLSHKQLIRYIPVPTGNSFASSSKIHFLAVYPCTYRELIVSIGPKHQIPGISLYLQGTPDTRRTNAKYPRYIPVPTGNSTEPPMPAPFISVYPCTYRELWWNKRKCQCWHGISLYLQGTPVLNPHQLN